MALSLRPYQAEGIDFLADRGHAALFDQPGLGKTMQSLLTVRELEPQGRLLVVTTGDAIGVWKDEARTWLDEGVTIFAGSGAEWSDPVSRSIVITNYHRLANVLRAIDWDGVIYDESQTLRNRKTRTLFDGVRKAYAANPGLRRAPLVALSGTPIVKAAGDLWPTLHLIDKKAFRGYWPFVTRHAVTWEDQHGWHVEGVAQPKRMWQELRPYCLRRTKREVQPWLPRKVRQEIPVQMTPKQAKAYWDLERDLMTQLPRTEAGVSEYLLAPIGIARDTRLRELLTCPRLLGIEEDGGGLDALVEYAGNNTHPLAVFTAFPSVFPYFEAALKKVHRPTFLVKGGMGQRLHESVHNFSRAADNKEAPVLLVSIELSKGWSISRVASEAWILGAPWTSMAIEQAEDRLHRDGQLDTVWSKFVTYPGTITEHLLEVIRDRRRLARLILDKSRQFPV